MLQHSHTFAVALEVEALGIGSALPCEKLIEPQAGETDNVPELEVDGEGLLF